MTTDGVSERKRAEETISHQAQLLANVNDAVVAADKKFYWTSWNPAAEKMYGWKEDEVVGRPSGEILHPEFVGIDAAEVSRILQETGHWRGEVIQYNKDGGKIYTEANAFALRDENGDITGYVSVDRDITEHKLAEEELRKAHDELEMRVQERTAELTSANVQLQREVSERKRTEEGKQENEERLRSIFEAGFEGIIIHDNGTILDTNSQLERMLGYPLPELVGESFLNLVAPESRDLIIGKIGSPPGEPYEAVGLRNDGTRLSLEIVARDHVYGGRPVRVTAVRDITERKRAEETIRESEERLRSIFKAGFEGIVIADSGLILDANPQLERMFGYPLSELVGKSVLDLTAPESRDLIGERIRSHSEEASEAVGLREDGSSIQVEIVGRDYIHKGRRVRAVAVRDVTERKRAEEAIGESEERFRQLAENVAEVSWLIDNRDDYRVLYVSPAYEKIWGRTCESLYDEPRSWLDAVHPNDLERVLTALERQQELGEFDEEFRIVRPDGTVRYVWDRGFPLRDESGEVYRLAGVVIDITERKLAEEQLQVAREELEGRVERQMLQRNPYSLTFRELTVLHLVGAGRSDKEIGLELGISPLTASKHVSNILTKMDAASRTEAVARGLREGLLD